MLRSLFILMLVALMAAVGFYYENQAGDRLSSVEAVPDHGLVAATAVRKVSEPEQATDASPEAIEHCDDRSEEPQTESLCTSPTGEEAGKSPEH